MNTAGTLERLCLYPQRAIATSPPDMHVFFKCANQDYSSQHHGWKVLEEAILKTTGVYTRGVAETSLGLWSITRGALLVYVSSL